MNGNHPDSETINVSFSDGRVDPGAATKTVVGTLATCMLAVAAGGGALVGYGHYYTTEISGAGMGDGFFYVGGLLLGIGITGAVAAWLRQTWLMLLVEIVLLLMFCLLYGFTIVAILLATETHNPVAYGIEKAWGKNGDNGLRAQALELDADRWCQKHTGVVGSCYSFYEDCEFAKKRTGTVCPYTITQMANDCKEKYTKYVGENLEPASTVSYLMLVFCVLASVVMTYLISAPSASGTLSRIGILINGLVALSGFCGVMFTAWALSTINKDCPEGQSCATGVVYGTLTFAFFVMVIACGASVGIMQDNKKFMIVANFFYIVFSVLMMMSSIFLSLATGAIDDIDTIYRDNWVSVRAELDSIDPPWCDQPWNMTLYPDPLQDPCMGKMKKETADKASAIAAVGGLVCLFVVVAMYFNWKAMKMIAHLNDSEEELAGRIKVAKREVAASKREIARERAELERQLRALKAS